MTRLLVVTAVDAERDAVLAGLGGIGAALDTGPGLDRHPYGAASRSSDDATGGNPASRAPDDASRTRAVHVLAAGVGAATAGAYTGMAIWRAGAAGTPYHIVCSLGIGGAFAGRAAIGDVVVGTRSVAADLGAEGPDGFLPLAALGLGPGEIGCDAELVRRLGKALPGAATGEILTVSTVTGTAVRAAALATRHPDAVVEAMEGYGVAMGAGTARIRFIEVRAISNLVGPRDREAWRIKQALAALSEASAALGTLVE